MAGVTCRDIFNAVYINVRGSYISKFYSSKSKVKTLSENLTEEENLIMTETSDPTGETNVNSRQSGTTLSENITESVQRTNETEVANKIRSDVEEKFPFALASVCGNLAALDREYRKLNGYEEQPEFSKYLLETTDDFPLSDRFAFPCIMFVSSMILIDVDEDKSDAFYDKYATAVSLIASKIPFECTSTVEKYPY